MSKTFHTTADLEIFQINPYNVRNWDNYGLTMTIKEDQISFLVGKNAPDDLQDLVNSMVVNNTIVINNAFITSPKGALVEGVYTLLSGNSRVILIRNMIELYTNHEGEKPLFNLTPLKYQIKGDYSEADLFSFQLSDNTGVKPSLMETLTLIYERRKMLLDRDIDNKYAGKEGAGKLLEDLKTLASPQLISMAKTFFEKCDPFIQSLVKKGFIKNAEIAILMQRALDNKELSDAIANAESLWVMMCDLSFRGNNPGYPTKSHLTKVINNLKEDIGEITDDPSVETINENDGENGGETKDPKSSKLDEVKRLRELPRDELNLEVLNHISELSEKLVNLNPELFDQNDVITMALDVKRLSEKLGKLKTQAEKVLDKAKQKVESEE